MSPNQRKTMQRELIPLLERAQRELNNLVAELELGTLEDDFDLNEDRLHDCTLPLLRAQNVWDAILWNDGKPR